MDNNKIGKFITELRKKRGLTQSELGEKLYVTDKAVSKWERGLSLPDITLLNSLADILEVNISEILNGEYGEDKNLNIEEAIKKAELKLKEELKIKKQKYILCFTIILIVLGISLRIIYSNIKEKEKYNPVKIVDGKNFYKLENYKIEEKGLDFLTKILSKTEDKADNYTISAFEIKLNNNGTITSFSIALDAFGEKGKYIGNSNLRYEENILHYNKITYIKEDIMIPHNFTENSTLEFLDKKIKSIPLKEQIKISKIDNSTIIYKQNERLEEGTCIYDIENDVKVKPLNLNDYNACLGGKNGEEEGLILTLKSNSDKYIYKFKYLYKNEIETFEQFMELDYYINNGTLKFTRDRGKTWIDTDISEGEITQTLNYYRDIKLIPNSWFISKDKNIPIAYFYGESPILKVSRDNGGSWQEVKFDVPKVEGFEMEIPIRNIGFTSNNFGYVALGTRWTMGTGEAKKIFFTYDGGKNWKEINAPLNGTRSTLKDMCMYDEQNGIIMLHNPDDINMPLIYATDNGGISWQEIKFSYFNLPDEIQYISDVDTITYEDGYYLIKLGQGNSGIIKSYFRTNSLTANWDFMYTKQENIHSVG